KIGISLLMFFSVTYALYEAWRIRWIADDAYISFRYILSFISGKGLTFNEGERVEGYTNFLWTVLLIPFRALGLDLEVVSLVLGCFFFGMLLCAFAFCVRKALSIEFAAVALLALCAHRHLQIFATSGLETMLFTFLATTGVLLLALKHKAAATEEPERRLAIIAFFSLALATLTRPDGAIIYAVCAGYLFVFEWRQNGPVSAARESVRNHLLSVGILFPVLVAKSLYYGSIVPNTFYAKSASHPYLFQGIRYAALYFESYWPLGIALILATVFWRILPLIRLPVLVVVAYLSFVVFVGGDFMFARFLIPITPLLFYCSVVLLSKIASSRARAVAFAAFVIAIVFRLDPFGGSLSRDGITEENRLYSRSARALLRETALSLRPALIRANPRIAFVGAQAAFAYYWYPLFAIESETGLTDKTIASQSIEQRGKVGHEKNADPEYLRSRHVHIWMRPPPPGFSGPVLQMAGIPGDMGVIEEDPRIFSILTSDDRFVVDGGTH
ncbi:MAG TPA: hypothetical protein PLB73_12665, partial [Leptospiraceae bacterium]|nr:hypothetical protein [Leptospiraceae bacterium]